MTAVGQAASGGDAGGEAAQGQQGGEAQQGGPDLGQLAETIQQLSAGQQEMQQLLSSAPWSQQDDGQQAGEGEQEQQGNIDLSFLDDPSLGPEQVAQGLQDTIRQEAQRQAREIVKQEMDPVRKELGDLRWETDAATLVSEFPELGEQGVADKVLDMSRSLAETLGSPALAKHPVLIKLVYMAGRAADAAQQEGDAQSPAAAHLEGGGGAVPGGSQQVDHSKLFTGAPRGSSVLDF